MAGVSSVGNSPVARESRASRRRKIIWNGMQKEALVRAFAKSPYPSFRAREQLAREIGLPESRVRVWFQNRRSRTGLVRQGPKPSTALSVAEPLQPHEESGARLQGRRSNPSGRRRLRTRLSSTQLIILRQAFERQPYPGFAVREELAQRTGLPEDTIHIWFQNRRARHRAAGKARVPGQDSPSCPPRNAPLPARETQLTQDSLLPRSAARDDGTRDLTLTCPPTSSGISWTAAPQPSSPADRPEAREVARLSPDPMLAGKQTDQEARDTLDLFDPWEQIQPSLEGPLDEEEYQALLDQL
ncbi:double homeobox protein 4C-like [Phodopus roborovskii]|uniref:double homeobox protein 4C-like n=1 Tax=Phodopus roborovskii TaxID=109678 RepID=UPI0021E439E9|nr:double homeobox protein 4C-like [Phodopus roborovskii]XP_051032243.1 double homeobox protein 4C-like [Phodopus roborovskii]XP_051032246.1 double homeobox protein 4C-like [Phodopus roborovskii]XP_051032248.1 double homeobox protein 4C-like [Phodopus roborovskii]XP_051032252.1 LOW QUALITY PROTEIN: double homeobox protein 4C-like [Phodopus roborovskii]XP_051032254.1 double homeobox protein 4C-like [Phodopus roborovskii]